MASSGCITKWLKAAPTLFISPRRFLMSCAAVIPVMPPWLSRYAKWLLSLRYSIGYKVIDVHFPDKNQYLEAHRRVDAKFNLDGFALTTDGVHPAELGHWIMAREILLYLGCDEVATSPGIEQSVV